MAEAFAWARHDGRSHLKQGAVRHSEAWLPTKAERFRDGWRASRDQREVNAGSRATADLLVAGYATAMRAHARGILLDVGCGKMPYFGIYGTLVSESIGVDWQSSLHESRHTDIFCDLNAGIELESERVDTILCTDVLEHIYAPARLWSEMYRILKWNGKAIIGVPFFYWLHEQPHDYHRYTRFALARYAADAGFLSVEIQPIGGLPNVLIDLCCKAVRKYGALADTTRRIGLALLRIPKLATYSSNSSELFPLAYIVIATKTHSLGSAGDRDTNEPSLSS